MCFLCCEPLEAGMHIVYSQLQHCIMCLIRGNTVQ
jgi:hypothetical protein